MTEKEIRVFVLDDEPDMAENLDRVLRVEGYETIVRTQSAGALDVVERERPDLIITDLRMPVTDGMCFLEQIRSRRWQIPVIMLTAYASIDSAVEAIRQGATDYMSKPFSPDELLLKVEKALAWNRLQEENRFPRRKVEKRNQCREILGEHPAVQEVLRLVDKVGPTDTRILLVGESGTGKDLVAQTIHRRSLRCDAPFFALNCGALTESLLESELFGHERGAFTGAVATKKGIFEAARGGTLFLDEISETSLTFQTKLLRVVEEGGFFRVGGTRPIKTDVRLISASNQDLRKAIAEGLFREDLFYRLSVVQISLPPLRDRSEDIALLAAHFLVTHSRRIGKEIKGIHPEALEAMTLYAWPGNIRELENVIERAVIMAEEGEEVVSEHLPVTLLEHPAEAGKPGGALKDAEREAIIQTLKACSWNRSRTARQLGIGRRTLYDKMARLGISLRPSL